MKFRKVLTIIATTIIFISLFNNQFFISSNAVSQKEANNDSSIVNNTSKKVEVKHLRTEKSKTFRNSNGSYSTEIFDEPIHYYDEREQHWTDINNTLNDNQQSNTIENTKNNYKVRFNKGKSNIPLVELQKNGNTLKIDSVNLKSSGNIKNNNSANINKVNYHANKIKYTNIFPDTDLQYTVGNSKIKEDIILYQKPEGQEPSIYSFSLNLKGLDYQQLEDGRILLLDKKSKKPSFYIEAPFMYDSSIPENYQKNKDILDIPEGAISYALKMDVKKQDNQLLIELIPDHEWLTSNEREYPVTIDPTIVTLQPNSQLDDTNIRSYFPNQVGGTETSLGVGLYKDSAQTNKIRSLLKFDLSAIPASSQIISADLNLWLSSVSNDLPINVDVYELSSSWTESGASWNKRNESTAWTNKGGDYKNTLLSTTGLSNLLDLSTNIKWKIPKDVVQKWIENPSTNHGFLLKSSDETKATYKKFISGDHPEFSSTSYSPMLVVSYYPISRLGFEDYWTYDYHPLTGGISATNLTTGNNIITV